jgi:hypothetical protein
MWGLVNSARRFGALVFLLGLSHAQAQVVGSIQDFKTGGWAKAENGLILSWRLKSEDAAESQVSISDGQGRLITSLKLLKIVPSAASAFVYDVSARPGEIIAVAADYVSREGSHSVRPASALLLFNFDGTLRSFFSLAPWRGIERLEIDEQSNIWTLTSIAEDGRDPAKYSMLVEYAISGDVIKQPLPRNLFPLHAEEIQGNRSIGFAHMGYDSGGVWFWLPGSTDLVIIPRSGDNPTIVRTGLPEREPVEVETNLVREESGDLVGQFREGPMARNAYYRWSPSTKSWTALQPGECNGGWLVGNEGRGLVYIKGSTPRACISAH